MLHGKMWFPIPDFPKIWFRPKIGFGANSFDTDCSFCGQQMKIHF
jgi:hypothetical protein